MTREELLVLTLRELDFKVAVLMGECRVNEVYPGTFRHYSSDDNAVRLVRNRIEELGLAVEFICKLNDVAENQWINAVFEYMQATPQQQCVAAILAVQEKERGE